jgi:hypothetical protein
VYLDETLIQTAARLFDDLWKFIGRAADPSVTISSSDGVVEETFSGKSLKEPLKNLTAVPWKKYRKKRLSLAYNLGEWMGYIITFLCIHFEVFPFSFFAGDPVIEWMSEKSRIGDDPNNTEFESNRERERELC